jgi:aquaporin Z
LASHWPEYLIEAWGLGAFMVSACVVGVVLEHPDSLLRTSLSNDLTRRAVFGVGMGLTAVGIVYSKWGKRSGAHINPAFTLTFWGLGKIAGWDALFYVAAQFAGGLAGVLLSAALLGERLAAPTVDYVVTRPGAAGVEFAAFAETAISFGVMLAVLAATNSRRFARHTGLMVGCILALYITFEAPMSGMSMNPARTLASALPAGDYTAIWIYFAAPALGMALAAALFRSLRGARGVHCAKLHHHNNERCIFRCRFSELEGPKS